MIGHPPRLALLLLRRWTTGPRRESLIGDLLEQHAQGRSRLWFWRQTGQAVLCAALDDGRHHARRVASASVMALALMYALQWIPWWGYQQVGRWVWNWSVENGYDSFRVLWFGRPHWPQPPGMLANGAVAFLVGVMIGRVYRAHAPAAVLAGAVAWPLFVAVPKLVLPGPSLLHLWMASPAWFVVTFLAIPVCFLVGGIVGTPDGHESLPNTGPS